MVPAWSASRLRIGAGLRGGAGALGGWGSGARGGRLAGSRGLLVAGQVALAMVHFEAIFSRKAGGPR
jgi:hypothetical protein